MAAWGVWTWSSHELNHAERYFGYVRGEFDGRLQDELAEVESFAALRLTREARADAANRMNFSARLLSLPESGETLADHLLAPEFLGAYFARREERSATERKN